MQKNRWSISKNKGWSCTFRLQIFFHAEYEPASDEDDDNMVEDVFSEYSDDSEADALSKKHLGNNNFTNQFL